MKKPYMIGSCAVAYIGERKLGISNHMVLIWERVRVLFIEPHLQCITTTHLKQCYVCDIPSNTLQCNSNPLSSIPTLTSSPLLFSFLHFNSFSIIYAHFNSNSLTLFPHLITIRFHRWTTNHFFLFYFWCWYFLG